MRFILLLLLLLTPATAQIVQFSGASPPVTCPYGSALADGCSGAQAHGTIVDAHLADPQAVIDLSVSGGSGYSNGTYTWTSSGGGCLVNATGTITVSSGELGGATQGLPGSYTISNEGSGCTSRPTISVPAGAGSGTGGAIVATVYQLTPHNAASTIGSDWNVAGVDYPVGYDTTLSLQDPTTAGLPSGCTFSGSTVTCAGSGGIFNGFDFTLHNTHLSITASGWTVSNNNFICGPHNTATGGMISIGTSVTSVSFVYNTLDGGDTIGGTVCDTTTLATIVDDRQNSGTFVFEYNLCYAFDAKCINFRGGTGGTIAITEKYNYYYDIGIAGSTHGESEYAFFGSNPFTLNWELGFNVAINRFYDHPSNATAPLAQQADAYSLNTTTHHNYAMTRGNQAYTGSPHANAPVNSAPVYLGEQNDPGTGTITGTATADLVDYSGAYFPYNYGSSSGGLSGNIADYNAGSGNACTSQSACN